MRAELRIEIDGRDHEVIIEVDDTTPPGRAVEAATEAMRILLTENALGYQAAGEALIARLESA